MIFNTTPSKLHIPKIGGSRSSSQGLCLTTILNSASEYISCAMWDMSISKIILFKTWICELSLIGRVLPKFYTGKQWNNSIMHDNKKSQNLLFSHSHLWIFTTSQTAHLDLGRLSSYCVFVCVCVCVCARAHALVCAQSCTALCNPTDCSPLSSSVHGILQAKILEWVAISSSRRSSWPRDLTHVSCVSCISR